MSNEIIEPNVFVTTTEYFIKPIEEKPKEVVEPKKMEIPEKKTSFRSNIKFTEIEVTDDDVFDNLKSVDEMWRQKIGYDNSNDSSEVFEPIYDNVIEVKKENEKIFTFAEEMPKYNGDLYEDLAKYIVYPEQEKNFGVECMLYVTFVVNKDGYVSDIDVLRPCEESDNFGISAVNAVKNLGKFEPAKMNGNPVSLKMTIPVRFSLK
jgi:TonB family protein